MTACSVLVSPRRSVTISLEASENCEVVLLVSYVVRNASWTSSYDVRVFTKDKAMKVSARPIYNIIRVYCTWTRELLDLNQSKAIQQTLTSLFPWKMEKKLLRWDSNPRHIAYEADDEPTELPRSSYTYMFTYMYARLLCMYTWFHTGFHSGWGKKFLRGNMCVGSIYVTASI